MVLLNLSFSQARQREIVAPHDILFSPLLPPLSPLWTIFHVVYVRVLLLAMCRSLVLCFSVFDVAAVAEFLPGIIIASIVRLRVRPIRPLQLGRRFHERRGFSRVGLLGKASSTY